jgi:hypothetical protein
LFIKVKEWDAVWQVIPIDPELEITDSDGNLKTINPACAVAPYPPPLVPTTTIFLRSELFSFENLDSIHCFTARKLSKPWCQ